MQRRYAAIAAAGALALSASPAAAHTRAKIKCGQTLTQSVRLTDDLVNCPGDGLVIGADGITVDLGGHTLDGVPLAPGASSVREPPASATPGTTASRSPTARSDSSTSGSMRAPTRTA